MLQPGNEPRPWAAKVQSLNHWAIGEFPTPPVLRQEPLKYVRWEQVTRRPGLGAGVWGAWAPLGERGGLVSLGSAGVGSEEAASQEVTPPTTN